MRLPKHILIALILLAASSAALAGDGVVITVRGDLVSTQAARVAGEIDRLAAQGVTTLLLDLALDSADDAAGLELAAAVAAAPEVVTVGVLVSRGAPGSAVAVVLAADRSFLVQDATVGPIPLEGPVRRAVAAAASDKGIPLSVFRRLLEPEGLAANAAVEAGIVETVCVGRAEALSALGIDPGLAEERQPALPGAERNELRHPRLKGPHERVFLIPIDREIDATLATSVERRIKEARAAGADLIIFEVDSPGGLVSASMDIGDLVFSCPVPTVMLIIKGAYSGAALISLAGNLIIMGEGGDIGDCQPIAIGPGGYQVLGEKIQSPLRAIFRKYARRNGHPIALAEAMVTEEMSVDRVTFEDGTITYATPEDIENLVAMHGAVVSRRNIVTEDELLTMPAAEAFEHGFCGEPVPSREAAFEQLGVLQGDVAMLDETWAEKTSRFLLALKVLLFFCGITALYMELKVPGFGVPGVIALVCFALFFSASAIAGISTGLEVVLFLIGVLLLVLEIFVIPGFGVAGFGGILLLFVSLYMASVKYPFPTPDRMWRAEIPIDWVLEFFAAVALSVGASVLLARYLPKTAIGRRVILAPAGPAGSMGLTGSGSALTQAAAALLGKHGTAVTDLRPAGRIDVDGEPFDAVTEGDFLARETKVVVIQVEGNRIVVEEA